MIPGLLLLLLGVHLWLVLKCGISAPPVAGQPVDPKTYHEEYEKELKAGEPFLGPAMMKDAFFSALVVITVVVIAALAGPKGPSEPPDPALAGANPRPDWPFLWLFGLLSLSPPGLETFIILVFPVILIVALAAGADHFATRRARSEPPAGRGAAGHRDLDDARRLDL